MGRAKEGFGACRRVWESRANGEGEGDGGEVERPMRLRAACGAISANIGSYQPLSDDASFLGIQSLAF